MKLTFGDRLLLLRKKQGLTIEQLSIRMTIPEQKITDWENDQLFPSFHQFIQLADLLDTSLDFLTCRIEEQPNKQWLIWASEIDLLSTKGKDSLFHVIQALINVDKMDRIYKNKSD